MSVKGPRVVVTGLGPVTPIGIGKEEFWAGLRREESGIGLITRFDPSQFNSHIAPKRERALRRRANMGI